MAKTLYIGGGRLFRRGGLERADLLARGGRIERIGELSPPRGAEVVDASGLAVLPGGIDNHVHFREPGLEAKEGYASGTRGALHGGVTSVLEIQNNPPLLVDGSSCRAKLAQVGPKARTDFGIYGNLVPRSIDRLAELKPWCVGLKLFLGGSTGMAGEGDYDQVDRLLAAAAQAGMLVTVHAEDNATLAARKAGPESEAWEHGTRFRPPEAEILAVEQALASVERHGTELHLFHLSTDRGAELVAQAAAAGLPVSSSTCPHYLYFRAEDARRLGNLLKVNPGIHGEEDRLALRRHLAAGRIRAWSTDHAPHFLAEKEQDYARAPAGIPSVDLFWPLLLTLVREGVLDLERAVSAAAEEPARIHGLAGKGHIDEGMAADLVLVDPEGKHRVVAADLPSRAEYSPYEGVELAGWPRMTILAGEPAFIRDPRERLHFPGLPRGRRLGGDGNEDG